MTWKQLLNENRVKRHKTSRHELDSLREVIERDLAGAAIPALSSDRRFTTAYNAALQAAKMAVACAGYRVSGIGHHLTTFEAAALALGSSSHAFTTYFDAGRRKRNQCDYDMAGVISETEADEIVVKAAEFHELVENWINRNHAPLAR